MRGNSMSQETIKCPNCGAEIELTEALSRDIAERLEKKHLAELQDLKKKQAEALEVQRTEMDAKLLAAKKSLEDKARQEAKEALSLELSDLKSQVDEKNNKLKTFQQKELEFRAKQRELEEKNASLELEVTRRIDAERQKIKETVVSETEEKHRLKDAEKDKQMTDMRKQIDDLKRKAEQGSQQNQGEVLELELEGLLKREFPFDEIEPVAKGTKGGDVIQTVKTQTARECGKILWELKRTKTYSDSWLEKLKEDQRTAKAAIAILVSETLPKGFHHFRQIDGVWLTDIPSAVSLAAALRVILIQVTRERELQTGTKEKAELIYQYVTGTEFKGRVEAIVQAFRNMRQELQTEKDAMERIWTRREKQIEAVIKNTVGMYGDLEGIAGNEIPVIKMLELDKTEDKT